METEQMREQQAEARDAIRNNPTESAIGWLRDGTRFTQSQSHVSRVTFTDAELDQLRGGRVMLHNHPSSNAFSPDDVLFAHAQEIGEMHVASRRADYVLRFTDFGRQRPIQEWRDVIALERRLMHREFDAAVRAGTLSEAEANVVYWHRVWTRLRINGWVEYAATPLDDEIAALYARWGS